MELYNRNLDLEALLKDFNKSPDCKFIHNILELVPNSIKKDAEWRFYISYYWYLSFLILYYKYKLIIFFSWFCKEAIRDFQATISGINLLIGINRERSSESIY